MSFFGREKFVEGGVRKRFLFYLSALEIYAVYVVYFNLELENLDSFISAGNRSIREVEPKARI